MNLGRDLLARLAGAERGPGGLNAFLSLAERLPPADTTGGGRLHGVPVAVKDNIVTLDLPTTCASRVLAGYRSPYEATVVRRLRSAGGWVVGKTNLDEFGMGSSTENSAFGPVRNPHDLERVPGGSSGGSAAAVAAGYVPMALGSDTGGSIRQPAALCGVVGIKPTYGRVSRYGLVAYASSLDQVGTFGRSVRDAATLLEVISGHDHRDATSADVPVPAFGSAGDRGVRGLVVGVPVEYFPEALDADIRERAEAALAALEAAGAVLRPVSLPSTGLAIPCFYVIAPAEASSNLARYDGARFGHRSTGVDVAEMYERTRAVLGAEVKRRIVLGTYVLSAGYHEEYYRTAQRVRARIRGEFHRVFSDGVDVLFAPTTPEPAFRLGERTGDPLRMYRSDVFTVTANLAGIPAISVPIGRVRGLPVGGQVLAPWWHEERMIEVAAEIERRLEHDP